MSDTKSELTEFIAYEVSNSFICSILPWKPLQEFMAGLILARTRRKYLNYKKFNLQRLDAFYE